MTDDVYAWRDLRFTLPPGLDDDTLLAFRGAGWSLTVARDVPPGGPPGGPGGASLEAYARAQEQALVAQRLPAYTADGPKPLEGTKGTLVVDRRFADAAGAKVFQRQCYVALGPVVALVTATAREAGAEKAKQAALDVVQSMHLGSR